MVTKLERLDIPELKLVYELSDNLRAEELAAANRYTKTSLTRMRKITLDISKNCDIIRRKALTMRKGGVANADG